MLWPNLGFVSGSVGCEGVRATITDLEEAIDFPFSVEIPPGDLDPNDPAVLELIKRVSTSAINAVLPIAFERGVLRVATVVENLADTIRRRGTKSGG